MPKQNENRSGTTDHAGSAKKGSTLRNLTSPMKTRGGTTFEKSSNPKSQKCKTEKVNERGGKRGKKPKVSVNESQNDFVDYDSDGQILTDDESQITATSSQDQPASEIDQFVENSDQNQDKDDQANLDLSEAQILVLEQQKEMQKMLNDEMTK